MEYKYDKNDLNHDLVNYIENFIFPQYNLNEIGHGIEHILTVIRHSFDIAKNQTDKSNFMEGLYIKLEDENQVLLRCKYIRESFINTILDSETHWADRPIIPNKLNSKFDESSIFYNG